MRKIVLVFLVTALSCGSGIDDKNGSNNQNNANNNQNNAQNNTQNNVQNNAQNNVQNNGNAANLTDIEWSMVGTWRSCDYVDKCRYIIIEPDRDSCSFFIDDDDARKFRVDEVHFRDWTLDTDTLTEEGLVDITKVQVNTGETWDGDKYDASEDTMHWFWSENDPFPHTWTSNVYLCDDERFDRVNDEAVERLGSLGNGDSTDTRLSGAQQNNENNAPTNNTNNENNGTNGPAPGG